MKQGVTAVLFLFVVQSGWSQMDMKLKPRFYLQKADSFTVRKIPFSNPDFQIINPGSSRFSHQSAAGLVYNLPQDNIPWLKPDTDFIYNMPVQESRGTGNIPNAYQQPEKDLLQSLRKQFQKDKKYIKSAAR